MKRDDRCRTSICHRLTSDSKSDSGDVMRASAPHTWHGSNKSLWCRCMRIPIVIKAHTAWVVAAFNWPLKKCFLSIISFWREELLHASLYHNLFPGATELQFYGIDFCEQIYCSRAFFSWGIWCFLFRSQQVQLIVSHILLHRSLL